jgi:hypothetical protein
MGKPAKRAFDAQVFLAKVGEGKSILQFKKGQDVFGQGDCADTVFYIQKGRIKLMLARIMPARVGFDFRTFECPQCAHVHEVMVATEAFGRSFTPPA